MALGRHGHGADVNGTRGSSVIVNIAGVRVAGDDSSGNRIRGNRFVLNTGPGIDLGEAGSDANDALDADTGPNGLQNAPVLTSVTVIEDGSAVVEGALESDADTDFEIDLYYVFPKPRTLASSGSRSPMVLSLAPPSTRTPAPALPGPGASSSTMPMKLPRM